MDAVKNRKALNQRMRRALPLLLALLLLLPLSACGSGEKKNIKVVTTIFPLYDWVRNLWPGEGKEMECVLLQDTGVDLHSYQPTVSDMGQIAACDLFIYVGGESDEWVEEALKNQTNPKRICLNLLDILGDAALEEEHKEGMQEDYEHEQGDHEHESEEHEPGEHEHEEEKDEHIWLSLKNAALCCQAIRDALKQLVPEQAEALEKNCTNYVQKLEALQKEYETAAAGAATKTLLFGDRFPFRYMTADLGLDYYAAFVGCSAETEASFETVIFLAKKLDELGLKVVLRTEGGNQKLAQTIIDASEGKSQKVLVLNSLQSVTGEAVKQGATYLGIMKENLEVLKEALK